MASATPTNPCNRCTGKSAIRSPMHSPAQSAEPLPHLQPSSPLRPCAVRRCNVPTTRPLNRTRQCRAALSRHTSTHPCDPAPCAAAMSTTTRPTSRPMQAPMSSMGTNTPEEMALPAALGGGAHTRLEVVGCLHSEADACTGKQLLGYAPHSTFSTTGMLPSSGSTPVQAAPRK